MPQIGRVAATALAGAIVSAAAAQDAVQWRVEDGGNGHWYQLVLETRARTDAAAACASRGGHLIDLYSDGEANFARTLGADTAWIGIIQNLKHPDYQEPDGGWFWDSGTAPTYARWRASSNEPNDLFGIEHTACMAFDSIEWNDVTGESQDIPAFFIEWSADCNDDGIVDYGQILDGTFADNDKNGVPDCCDADASCEPIIGQWTTASGGNGHWYATVPIHSIADCWDESNAIATAMGGYLATILESAENDFIFGLVSANYVGANCSIGGLVLPDGEWGWVTGEPWGYTNWQSGEPGCCAPDEYWLDFNVGSGRWRDRQLCVVQYPDVLQPGIAIVEWSGDCNGDGIVDYGQILDGTFVDENKNGIPDCCDDGVVCDCPADLNSDGMVGPPDLGILLALWNTDGSPNGADLNDDGIVTAADLGLLVGAWGACN